MEINKKNGNVCFNESKHIYWNDKTNNKYVSVTTLIHKFTPPFDEEFWSNYKAFERLADASVFKMHKKEMLTRKKISDLMLQDAGINISTLTEAKEEILKEWELKKNISCERGTNIHADRENSFYTSETHEMSKHNFGGKLQLNGEFICKKNNFDLSLSRGIFPEYLVYSESNDGKLTIAGQIDLLIKDGNDIYIVDFKTNKELKFKSGMDFNTKKNATMLYPLNNLMDCNIMHYTLQLSTYAWMLQKINPEFRIKQLLIVHYDHEGNTNYHELEYIKKDVERMLGAYKKQLVKETYLKNNKEIEY